MCLKSYPSHYREGNKVMGKDTVRMAVRHLKKETVYVRAIKVKNTGQELMKF